MFEWLKAIGHSWYSFINWGFFLLPVPALTHSCATQWCQGNYTSRAGTEICLYIQISVCIYLPKVAVMLCFPFWPLMNLTMGLWSRFWICFAQYQTKDQTNLLRRDVVLFLMVKQAKGCSLLSPHVLWRTEVSQPQDKVILLQQNYEWAGWWQMVKRCCYYFWVLQLWWAGCPRIRWGFCRHDIYPLNETVQASETAQEPVCEWMSQ